MLTEKIMSQITGQNSQLDIDTLLKNHRIGYSLEQPFYTDHAIFEEEYKHILSRQWQYTDHMNRIPNKGDYFLFNIAGEQIIIIRGEGDTVYAHFNVCRHRGSRVCLEPEGHAKRLVCPYHAWSYQIDGSLANARAMPADFDKADFGLRSCQVRLFGGMIFINLTAEGEGVADGDVPDFDEITANLQPWIERADLRRTKIIEHKLYSSKVNWKIAIENYFECYHCITSHPELCKVQLHTLRDAHGTESARSIFAEHNDDWQERAKAFGHKVGSAQWGANLMEQENYGSQMHYAERMLVHHDLEAAYGQLEGGSAIGSTKLLGSYAADDQGQVDWGIMPSIFLYTSCTSTVIFRITPISPLLTEMSQTWLVHEDAVEGVDYNVEAITWIDEVTMEQDEEIVVNTQAGVSSRVYTPGPYAELEEAIAQVHNDYLRRLRYGRGLAE
jgi:phenylpropionate dioxygenase-like ring-hydroxylating dioxygenase large terminal subunit